MSQLYGLFKEAGFPFDLKAIIFLPEGERQAELEMYLESLLKDANPDWVQRFVDDMHKYIPEDLIPIALVKVFEYYLEHGYLAGASFIIKVLPMSERGAKRLDLFHAYMAKGDFGNAEVLAFSINSSPKAVIDSIEQIIVYSIFTGFFAQARDLANLLGRDNALKFLKDITRDCPPEFACDIHHFINKWMSVSVIESYIEYEPNLYLAIKVTNLLPVSRRVKHLRRFFKFSMGKNHFSDACFVANLFPEPERMKKLRKVYDADWQYPEKVADLFTEPERSTTLNTLLERCLSQCRVSRAIKVSEMLGTKLSKSQIERVIKIQVEQGSNSAFETAKLIPRKLSDEECESVLRVQIAKGERDIEFYETVGSILAQKKLG